MSEKNNRVDQFYSDALKSYSQSASGYAWIRMRWKLLWINYGRYLIGIGAVFVIGLAMYFGIESTGDVEVVVSPNEAAVVKNMAEANPLPVNQADVEDGQGIETVQLAAVDNPSLDINTITKTTNKGLLPGESIGDKSTIEVEPVLSEDVTEEDSNLERYPEIYTLSSYPNEYNVAAKDEQSLVENALDQKELAIHENHQLKKTWVSLGFYAAPAVNFYRLNGKDEEYLNYREKHETATVSWSAGADVRINIKNWYIQTGLTYAVYKLDRNYNHSFEALDSLNSYYQADTIWGWAFDPPEINKPIVLGFDTTYVPVYNDINEGTNEWHYLEIPLLAGYKFNRGRFSFDIGTGFSYGFLLYASGNVPGLEQENTFVELENTDLNQHMFNYLVQVGVSYHLTPAWSLNLAPWYKHNLNSVFDNNYPVDQRVNAIGINFGLRVNL